LRIMTPGFFVVAKDPQGFLHSIPIVPVPKSEAILTFLKLFPVQSMRSIG
jgi:hypothetical protein